MPDHKRLLSLLQIIRLLRQSGGYPVNRLAGRFEVTERTIYRYFGILRETGFDLEKEGDRYRIASHTRQDELLPVLDPDETGLLRDAVLSVHATHPRKPHLLKKLAALSDLEQLAELVVDRALAGVIRDLTHAVKERRRIILRDYNSPNSRTIRDREVEPVGFGVNMRYLYALDTESGEIRQFKPDRIGRVEVLGKTFTPGAKHRVSKPDLFGMNGRPRCTVTLRLNQRAIRLLLEEYPESEIQLFKNQLNRAPEGVNWLKITLKVNGFEGVSRFVLGLPGEAGAEGPEAFIQYLETRMSRGAMYLKGKN
ncbi:MAG: WYL domain-containing protein [Balneolales bacterium]